MQECGESRMLTVSKLSLTYNPGQNICETTNYLTNLIRNIVRLEKPPPNKNHSMLITFAAYS
jgi:hypothetical protein